MNISPASSSQHNSASSSKEKDADMSKLSGLPPSLKLQLLSMLQSSDSSASKKSSSAQKSQYETSKAQQEYWQTPVELTEDDKKLAAEVAHQLRSNGVYINDHFISDTEKEDQFKLDDIIQEIDWLESDGMLKKAGLGAGSTKVVAENTRGDLHCWLSDTDSTSPSSQHEAEQFQHIRRLRSLVGRIKQIGRVINTHFNLQFYKCSIQVARYPGNGALYARHADSSPLHSTDRRVTALLYLNDEEKLQGGNLRLYRKERSLLTPAVYKGDENDVEVKPIFPRLIIFPSECYHEVLPAYSSRCSLTCWFYTSAHDIASRIERGLALPSVPVIDATAQESLRESRLKEQKEASILVSICSYRDSECQHTVKDLFEKAAHSERISLGICWQYDREKDMESCFGQYNYHESPHATKIREIHMDHRAAKGPVFARALIQQHLFRGEDFFLQIDSHMRFEQNWDTMLVEMLQQCEQDDPSAKQGKCVLSAYPPGYTLPSNIPAAAPPTILCAKRDFVASQLKNPDQPEAPLVYYMTRLHARVITKKIDAPVKGLFWAAGFSFSRGCLVSDVPYPVLDLQYCFFGEETYMLYRMFEKGYRMYVPNKTVIYHLWSRDYRPTIFSDQRGQSTAVSSQNTQKGDAAFGKVEIVQIPEELLVVHTQDEAARLKLKSSKHVMEVLGMLPNSVPSASLSRFQDFVGIDFVQRIVSSYAQFGGFEDRDALC